jgi:predicted nucleic acid-binding protein
MRTVFADTFYWVALADPRDQSHAEAKALSESLGESTLVTTEEVLSEFLNFFSQFGSASRQAAVRRVRAILSHPHIQVVGQSHASFLRGLGLYEKRPDKEYSLTDCISMTAMRQASLTEVLTNDHHFAQEGFTILFGDEA